ncbi:uncharacterized protein LOC135814479 [Sycon ciliatum]|uniref:uncharacterized protein LOC135814479 n=1 Tax=Sycon ciliatum TaxID=27933 RepID=UPI0031F6D652|eukprot:scpid54915/ scgid16022/ 
MGGGQSSTGGSSTTSQPVSPLQVAAGQCFDELADTDQVVTAAAFEHLFSGPAPGFGSRLFKALFGQEKPKVGKPAFVEAFARLLSRDARQSETIVKYLTVFSDGGRVQPLAALTCACKLAIQLSAAGGDDEATVDVSSVHFLEAAAKSVGESSSLTVNDVSEWVQCNMPGLFDALHCWLERAIWSSGSGASDVSAFELPRLVSSSGSPAASDLLGVDGMWLLSTFLPPCYLGHHKAKMASSGAAAATSSTGASAGGQWNLLYNSRDQGLSLNRFKHHVMDYRGPNVCCIRCDRDTVFALGVDGEWRESSTAWGGNECVLAQLRPAVCPLASGPRLLVLNEKTRGIRLGLSVGRDQSRPALTIDESLDKLTVSPPPSSSAGQSREQLTVRAVEVWGCGGADLQDAQRKQKDWDKKQVERRRQVKRPGRWEENPDAMLLEWGGVHTTSNFGVDRKGDEDKE